MVFAPGTNRIWANIVPNIRPPTIKVIHLSKCSSLQYPLRTPSVNIDINGSININIRMVATPLIQIH